MQVNAFPKTTLSRGDLRTLADLDDYIHILELRTPNSWISTINSDIL